MLHYVVAHLKSWLLSVAHVWGCRNEDMVTAAVIALADPIGSHAEDILGWLEVSMYNLAFESGALHCFAPDQHGQPMPAVQAPARMLCMPNARMPASYYMNKQSSPAIE